MGGASSSGVAKQVRRAQYAHADGGQLCNNCLSKMRHQIFGDMNAHIAIKSPHN